MPEHKKPLLENRLDIHDRKQVELKLGYGPSGEDSNPKYNVDAYIFLPASLNIDEETYPRAAFYADLHNYVRLTTPILSFDEIVKSPTSPLVKLEARIEANAFEPEGELVYQAKMLSCVLRGALRRYYRSVQAVCNGNVSFTEALESETNNACASITHLFARFRLLVEKVEKSSGLLEKTRASFRLVDEYMSLSVEQFFRKAVAKTDRLPHSDKNNELRRALLTAVVGEERYRKSRNLGSVLSLDSDNEEYTRRLGVLKKFCMNVLFLAVRRRPRRQAWEEVLFGIAAGVAMTFATLLAFLAQMKLPQASFNLLVVLVVAYIMKDRIKEGMRRQLISVATRHLFDRVTRIIDPATQEEMGVCFEKVDYIALSKVPLEARRLRHTDDLVTVAEGELAETVIRYQKDIELDSALLPKVGGGLVTGVTDIIRWNVERLLRDMDDPEYALEYIDIDDLSVGRLRAAKSYHIDVAFRFTVDDGDAVEHTWRSFRLVLDRNGLKRMVNLDDRLPTSPPLRLAAGATPSA